MNLLTWLRKRLERERSASSPAGKPLFGCVVVDAAGRVRVIRFAPDDAAFGVEPAGARVRSDE
jgi:hypothetical protein